MKKKRQKPGSKPDNLQIDGSWEDAVKKAVKKKKPKKSGWPKKGKNSK